MMKLTGVSQSRWSLKKWKELWIFLCPTFVSYFISEPKIHHLYSFITHSQWSYFQSHFCFPHFGYEQRLLVFLLNYSSLVGEGEQFLIKPFWNFRLGSLLIFWLVHLPVSVLIPLLLYSKVLAIAYLSHPLKNIQEWCSIWTTTKYMTRMTNKVQLGGMRDDPCWANHKRWLWKPLLAKNSRLRVRDHKGIP